MSKRSKGCGFVGLSLLLLCVPACTQSGHLTFLGYSTQPVYDPTIRTVYVPIFENISFRRGLEFEMTRAVVREIEASSPFKVVSRREDADTELLGKIVNWRKSVINVNQLNEVREAEIAVAVELVWRDLRPGCSGEVLSQPRPKGIPATAVPVAAPAPPPLLVEPTATYAPEVGGTRASAEKMLVDNLARGIVFKMEIARPW